MPSTQCPKHTDLFFYLKYYYEFTGAEIAAKTGLTQSNVRQKCMLGMRFIRKYIKETENGE